MKKWFSMLLVVVMVVSVLAGCGNKETTKESTQKPASSTSETKKEESKVEEKEEPTLITIGSTNGWLMDPMPWYETEVWKVILEEANVEVKYVDYDEEKFNLMLTSGDLPDIVFSTFGGKVDDIIKSGLALDLTSYIDEYAPNMALDVYQQRNELVSSLKGGEDNALYFIAPNMGLENARGGTDSSRGYNIRWDYYKELGTPEINSDDDYIDVLEQMVKAHPETENEEKTYAMGLDGSLGMWYTRAAFVKPVLANIWTFSGSQYMSSYIDGHLVNGYTEVENSAYWTDMKFYNKLYNKGLLDPDSFTQTADEFYNKVYAGRYMATPSKINGFYSENAAVDPETLAGMVRIPSENHIVFGNKKALLGNFPSHYMFVSKDTKNVEAVMRFLNVLHDLDTQRMLYCGIEGTHWNYVDGVPTFTDEMEDLIATGSTKLAEEIGVRAASGIETVMRSFEHSDGYPVDLREAAEAGKF